MKHGKWSDEELAFLRASYDNNSRRDIALKLNRTLGSVVGALNTFGIKKKKLEAKEINCCDLELAYIAGIIDGEGNIQITKVNPGRKYGAVNPTYELKLVITNTDMRLINWLEVRVGGFTTRTVRPGRNVTYKLILNTKQSIELLNKVHKYLVIKKDQTDLVFSFRKTYDSKYPRKRKMNLDIIKQRECFYRALMKLHKKELSA